MKKLALIAALSAFATVAYAMPIAPLQRDDGSVVQVRKGGGSSRSAKSGRFVSGSYAGKHKSTTITHGKY